MSFAESALRGDKAVLDELASRLLIPRRDNFVERPWGGGWLTDFKRTESMLRAGRRGALPFGEAFEIAAFDDDPEASAYPSLLELEDGSVLSLPALLGRHGARLLGEAFVSRHGNCFPLLPKTLNIKELLSIQGHPEGHTEVYIIIDAEPGATLRLGFNRDMDAPALEQLLKGGLATQETLTAMLRAESDLYALQSRAAAWLADQAESSDLDWLDDYLESVAGRSKATELMLKLKRVYWQMLDSMNAIEVAPGQVIHNSTPGRLLGGGGRQPSAEVHALGNPEGYEILALEIRRPGPTFRAWDNVRFPARPVDVSAAIQALNLKSTGPEDFICPPAAQPNRPGIERSVDSEYFCIDHLYPKPAAPIDCPAAAPHCLHLLDGSVIVRGAGDIEVGRMERGDSALVPVGVGAYTVEAGTPAHLVRVSLPES